VTAAIVAACTSIATSNEPDLGGLLVLSGKPGDSSLQTWEHGAAAKEPGAVKTPTGTTWVAGGLADVLVAGLVDGSLRTSDPLSDTTATWHKVAAKGAEGTVVQGPFYFPTWDPEGGRFAALAGDLDADPRLTLVDPSTGSAFEVALGRPVVEAPPAWVGDDLVAVAVGDASTPGAVLVDTTTAKVRDGPSGGRLLATSADGATIAVVGGRDGDGITIRTTEGWLSGDGSSVGSIDPPPNAVAPVSLALDAKGTRLAIAWLTDGGTVDVAIHDRTDGWRRVASLDQGKVAGAEVAWLR